MNKETVAPVQACLQNYLTSAGPKVLAAKFNVPTNTVKRWVAGPPHGERFVKLAYFLAKEGYRVQEIVELPDPIFNIGKLFFADLLGFDTLAQECASAFPTGRKGVMRIFSCPQEIGPVRLNSLDAVYQRWIVQHPEVEHLFTSMRTMATQSSRKMTASTAAYTLDTSVSGSVQLNRAEIIQAFSAVVNLGISLGSLIISEGFTVEERHALRSGAFKDARLSVFADIINGLTSERAREMILEQQSNKKG